MMHSGIRDIFVKSSKPPLLGRKRLQKIKLNWGKIISLQRNKPLTLKDMLENHKDLFKDGYFIYIEV